MSKRVWAAVLGFLFAIVATQTLRYLWSHPPFDFAPFYLGGKLAASGHVARVYDIAAYQPLLPGFFAEGGQHTAIGNYYFIRPAFEAFYYVPFSYWPYRQAALLDGVVNFIALGLLIWKLPVWFSIREPIRPWMRLGLLSFYPFYWSILLGQDTLWLALLVAYAFRNGSQKRPVAAGLVLALGVYKPHLLWVLPLVLIAEKRWKMLYAFVGGSAVLAAVSLFSVGTRGLRAWQVLLNDPSTDISPMVMGNLRALGLHFGTAPAIAAACLVLASLVVVLWKGSLERRVAVALLSAILFSPHAYWQDYALASVALALTPQSIILLAVLLPWPFLYTRLNELPMVGLAIAWVLGMALQTVRNQSIQLAPLERAAEIAPKLKLNRGSRDILPNTGAREIPGRKA